MCTSFVVMLFKHTSLGRCIQGLTNWFCICGPDFLYQVYGLVCVHCYRKREIAVTSVSRVRHIITKQAIKAIACITLLFRFVYHGLA